MGNILTEVVTCFDLMTIFLHKSTYKILCDCRSVYLLENIVKYCVYVCFT